MPTTRADDRTAGGPLALPPMRRSLRRITDVGMSEHVVRDYSDTSIAAVA